MDNEMFHIIVDYFPPLPPVSCAGRTSSGRESMRWCHSAPRRQRSEVREKWGIDQGSEFLGRWCPAFGRSIGYLNPSLHLLQIRETVIKSASWGQSKLAHLPDHYEAFRKELDSVKQARLLAEDSP
ncbi:hypothetical protein GUJ93_ZPchr0007g5345 [Zizania palustris]|uniref:Uncharacterized protein n=1 Tax=Zizania palustris TaxID=103762 RepID=A0A8J5VQZ2_ZIZPA|nr:hypothetical protein GUJ93_ZPchr0007g5345 [Zizania palustris]